MRKTQLRGLAVIAAATVSLSLTSCGGRGGGVSGDDAGTFTIKFSHVVTENTPKGKASLRFKELVEKNSGGKIKVEIYPNSELYGDKDELQALQSNSVQMLAPSSAKFTTIAPELQVLDLPFLFDSMEDIPKVASPETTVGKAIYSNQQLAAKGIKVLGLWDNGLKQLSSNKPMTEPADLKGQSFRIQPSDVLESQFQTWGGSSTPMAFSEVYNALQQGVVDGQENTYANIESQKMHTVQKHLTEANHGYIGYVLVVNDGFFNKLPKNLQDVVSQAANEASTYNRQITEQLNDQAKQNIEKAGSTEITVLTDDQRQAFKDTVVPSVWREYEDVIGSEIIDELLKEQGK